MKYVGFKVAYIFHVVKLYSTVDSPVYAIEGTGKFRINERVSQGSHKWEKHFEGFFFKGPKKFRINERVS